MEGIHTYVPGTRGSDVFAVRARGASQEVRMDTGISSGVRGRGTDSRLGEWVQRVRYHLAESGGTQDTPRNTAGELWHPWRNGWVSAKTRDFTGVCEQHPGACLPLHHLRVAGDPKGPSQLRWVQVEWSWE